jgi:putative heme uptake system protein
VTDEAPTYLLVDGENIDATLGIQVLGHRPQPEERPRWERVRDFSAGVWGQPVKPLFFLNATTGQLPLPFVQALMALRYQPIPLAGSGDRNEKVVDIGIQRTLDAILDAGRGDVLLASHDADFVAHMSALATDGRRVGVVAFSELVSQSLREVAGLEIFDLEHDAGVFEFELPRVRIIPLDEFDPLRFL